MRTWLMFLLGRQETLSKHRICRHLQCLRLCGYRHQKGRLAQQDQRTEFDRGEEHSGASVSYEEEATPARRKGFRPPHQLFTDNRVPSRGAPV